jgi:hypothetical protein
LGLKYRFSRGLPQIPQSAQTGANWNLAKQTTKLFSTYHQKASQGWLDQHHSRMAEHIFSSSVSFRSSFPSYVYHLLFAFFPLKRMFPSLFGLI